MLPVGAPGLAFETWEIHSSLIDSISDNSNCLSHFVSLPAKLWGNILNLSKLLRGEKTRACQRTKA